MDVRRSAVSKVPRITALFWVTKLLTTAMGEATSDYLVNRFNPVIPVALAGLALIAVLVVQFRSPRYVPWIYWLTVAMVAVTGTMAADVLHKQFGVPYAVSTTFFAIVLAVVFVAWDRVEHSLSIHTITTPRREAFYWATVMATFALGTAAGDLVATTFTLGFFAATLVFIGLILIPAVGYFRFHMNEVLAFWFAYVVTRPIGASLADWTGKSKELSGLGWGDGPVALVLTAAIVIMVGYLTVSGRDTPDDVVMAT
jgi:uncharacterized membrane-anchored protein